MAVSTAHVFSMVVAVFSPLVAADAFLSTRHQSVSIDAIQEVLFAEAPDTPRIAELLDELRPMYESLPKTEHGLESSTVRYALHRYFVHKYGWYMKGLDGKGGVTNNASSTEVAKGFAPAFIMGLFEQRLQGKGLQLGDLAVFAAALSDLIFQEGLGSLQEVYEKLHLSGPVSEEQLDIAIRAYFSQLALGPFAEFNGEADFALLETDVREVLPDYDDTIMWFQDLRKTRDFLDREKQNPFKADGISWERAADHVREMMQHFGGLTKNECANLKEQLQAMEAPGTGRVLLSDFYSNSQLPYKESVAFLRNLGVLEEEGMQRPRLIMANYITSVGIRCFPFSSYFSVCCHNDCEDLMGNLEKAVKAPHATPAQIMEVVAGLGTESKPAPWTIPQKLEDRLQDISRQHDGQVPLHGRLFMQWMHHAFPQECAFPHVSGTTSPVSQDEWLVLHEDLEDVLALDEDIKAHSKQAPGVHAGLDELPWAAVEELVAIDKPSMQARSRTARLIRTGMGLAAVVSCALLLGRGWQILLSGVTEDKDKIQVV